MCDVSDEKQVKALVDEPVAKFGKLDFAHNNAGINIGQTKIGEMGSAAWDKTLQVTLYGIFYSIKHQVNAMIKTGGGAIVNTASGAGIEGSPNMAPYTASKFGIVGLTKSVALEYGQQGIRVNAIAPGATITPAIEGWAKSSPDQYNAVLQGLPSGYMSTPVDHGNAVMFYCSDLSTTIYLYKILVALDFTAGNI